jgi:hypothetical protein
VTTYILPTRRRAFHLGSALVAIGTFIFTLLWVFMLLSSRQTTETVGSSFAWKFLACGTGILGLIALPLVLCGRGSKRIILAIVSVSLIWIFLLPYGIQVR